jgi:two-component system response regulator HydG
MSHPYLLLVHPDESSRGLLRCMLQGLKYRIVEAPGYRIAIGLLGHDPDALVLAGADPGNPEAMEFLAFVQRQLPQVPHILLLSGSAPELASQALRHGAASVLKFPLPTTQVRAAVVHALNRPGFDGRPTAQEDPHPVPKPPARRPVEAALVGEDAGLRQALELARGIASIRNPVLIVGEAGTGKSLLARIIHELGPRRNGPFLEFSCAMTEKVPLEEVLFGEPRERVEVGRFGKVPRAHGGTLVLDERAALSPALQLKLHMILGDGRYEPIGSTRTGRVDVRLILTSRGDRANDAAPGRFWQSIYARNSTITLRMPPLRDRGSDVVRLAESFLTRSGRDSARNPVGFSPEALDLLCRHTWPGNVAELKDVINDAVSSCQGPRIEPSHLRLTAGIEKAAAAVSASRTPSSAHANAARYRIQPLREDLAEPEKWLILRALHAWSWNRQEVANVLEINRATLDKKMKKYGLLSSTGQILQDCFEGIEP